MKKFEPDFFKKYSFTKEEISLFLANSKRDLDIAKKSVMSEVIFRFGYDSMIKAGITLIAFYGFKVKSVPGHHFAIIRKLSELLGPKYAALFDFCNEMRRKRNIDLYAGGMIISSQEAGYLLKTAEKVYFAVKNIIKKLL
ncbi:hypothetical protein HZA39_01135 [Candidatus Peregrinibacteria bacterium]|nr:hypothetical protein [Candidatus Peregrinibacteria bacterium]